MVPLERVAPDIRAEDIRNADAAVFLLVRLEQRGDDPGQRQPGPVERADQLRLRARLRPIADPRLGIHISAPAAWQRTCAGVRFPLFSGGF
jgi:hypothetical protein